MGLRVGPHNFNVVTYDASSDVVYATRGSADSSRRETTPEDHVLLFDEDGKFHGVALMEPRERLERDGSVWVTLPTGEHVRVAGLEFALRSG